MKKPDSIYKPGFLSSFFFCPLRELQWKATLNPGFRTMTARTGVLARLLIIRSTLQLGAAYPDLSTVSSGYSVQSTFFLLCEWHDG